MSADVCLVGRMVGDMVNKMTKTGKVIHTFSVASNRGWGDSRQTDYVDCMAFAPVLDKQEEVMKKGAMVKVLGHLQSTTKDEPTGKRTYWNLIVTSAEVLFGTRAERREGSREEYPADNEDIPF